jgi:tetratricopeptide (TPR) repeat protein
VNPSGCPDLGQPFGDYLVDKDKVALSERFHFTPEVENLVRGKSSERIGADIDFMLTNYPNHHRALVAMMRLGEKLKSPQPPGARASVECYFVLALKFRRDDPVARMLYANFLARNKREVEAAAQLELVRKAVPNDPLAQYNIGLIYLDMKNYAKALEQAHTAQDLGVTRTDLRDQLKRAGQWKEPERAAAPASSPQIPASGAGS